MYIITGIAQAAILTQLNLHWKINMINLKREGLPVLNQVHLAQAWVTWLAVIPQGHHESLHALHHLSLRKTQSKQSQKEENVQKRRKENRKVLQSGLISDSDSTQSKKLKLVQMEEFKEMVHFYQWVLFFNI